MKNNTPDAKVMAGSTVGLLAWLLAEALSSWTGLSLPEGAVEAIGIAFAMLAAYRLPQPAREVLDKVDGYLDDGVVSVDALKAAIKRHEDKNGVSGGGATGL